jgi:hypothetical protein
LLDTVDDLLWDVRSQTVQDVLAVTPEDEFDVPGGAQLRTSVRKGATPGRHG